MARTKNLLPRKMKKEMGISDSFLTRLVLSRFIAWDIWTSESTQLSSTSCCQSAGFSLERGNPLMEVTLYFRSLLLFSSLPKNKTTTTKQNFLFSLNHHQYLTRYFLYKGFWFERILEPVLSKGTDKRRFTQLIDTDGVSVSLHFRRPLKDGKKRRKAEKDEWDTDQFGNAVKKNKTPHVQVPPEERVIVNDPGRWHHRPRGWRWVYLYYKLFFLFFRLSFLSLS